MRQPIIRFLNRLLLLGLFLGSGCRQARVETAISSPMPTVTATPSPLPTQTAVSTAPPQPTATSQPTASPAPTVTPTPSFPIYQGAPLQPALMGIQLHLRDEDQDELFAHLEALRVGWVKVQISWKLYQPFPDTYHEERIAELDRFVQAASDRDIQVLLGVSKAPEWSRPTTELDGPPADFALYETFMAYLANRYRGQVAAYELWNEPNLQREWNGRALSAADLVALIRAGAAGVRQHDTAATLISAAPATTGINDGITAIDDRLYLRQMLEAGVADWVDGIGVHPYGWANPPDSTTANPAPHTISHNNHPSFFFADTLADYQAIMAEFNVALPLWATEFGWGSFDGLDAPPPTGVEYMNNVTAWQQAEYTLRAYELAQTNAQIGPLFLWNLNFGPLLGTAYAETGYSILQRNGTPRPAYWALQAALGNE